MMWLDDYPAITDIYNLVLRLGATPNYTGFFQTIYAIYFSLQEPQLLHLVTKRLYPKVAKHCGTSWKSVDRNIRTVVDVVWKNNSSLLSKLARCPLQEKPSVSKFISILSSAFVDTTSYQWKPLPSSQIPFSNISR